MAQHTVAFDVKGAKLETLISGQLAVYHILGSQCKCSKKIAAYLAESKRPSSAKEIIVSVDGHLGNEATLVEKGFIVQQISAVELKEQFNLDSAPVMLVNNRWGKLKYTGGYKKWDDSEYRDLEILNRLNLDEDVAAYPVFGCALSSSLKNSIDPFKIKYIR